MIAPASTGSESNNKKVVTRIDQTNSGMRCRVSPGARMFRIVVMKLIELKIEEAPAKCRLKITRSTAGPGCPVVLESGG